MNTLSDWVPALVPALLAVVALWGPGLLVAWALGLSKWRTVAFAPLASAGVIAIGSTLTPYLGLRWGWIAYLGSAVVIAVLALILGRLVTKRWGSKATGPRTNQPIPSDPKLWPAFVGTLISMPFTIAAFISGIGKPELPTQTWDGMFHLSAVQWILKTGNGSTLNLNAVASNLPESASTRGSFYPAGFHDLVALTVTDNVIVATNAVVIVLGTILFPLAVAMLASLFMPKSPELAIFVALLASAFSSFPERPASYGVLWPTVYAYALVPLVVIALADWFGRTNQPTMSLRSTFIGLLGAIGIAIIHPTGVLVALIAGFVLIIDLIIRLIARTIKISGWQAGLLTVVILGLAGISAVMTQTAMWKNVTAWGREPVGSFLRESFGVIFDSQLSWMGYGDAFPEWVLGGLTIIGALVALWLPRTRWLLFTYGIASYFFVASAVIHVPGYQLVAPWYSDPVRLGAIVPLFGAPLAGFGAWAIYRLFRRIFQNARQQKLVSAVGITAMSLAIIVGTHWLGYYAGSSQLYLNYEFKNESGLNGLVNEDELKFIQTLPRYVEPDAKILADPRTGGTFIYALTGLDVTFRHVDGNWSKDYAFLGKHFDQVLDNPKVCEALKRNNIKYFYTDSLVYWPESPVGAKYAGLEAARAHLGAFTPIAAGGGATLYEITPCEHVPSQ